MPLMDRTVEERQETEGRERGRMTHSKGHPMQDLNWGQLQQGTCTTHYATDHHLSGLI